MDGEKKSASNKLEHRMQSEEKNCVFQINKMKFRLNSICWRFFFCSFSTLELASNRSFYFIFLFCRVIKDNCIWWKDTRIKSQRSSSNYANKLQLNHQFLQWPQNKNLQVSCNEVFIDCSFNVRCPHTYRIISLSTLRDISLSFELFYSCYSIFYTTSKWKSFLWKDLWRLSTQ